MNDLKFIAYDAKIMLVDTLMMDPATELAHRRLCDHIWATDTCPDIATSEIREFCKCPPEQWMRVHENLLKKGWFEKDGKLHHGGTERTLEEAHRKHKEATERATTAATTRWTHAKAMRKQCTSIAGNDAPSIAQAMPGHVIVNVPSSSPKEGGVGGNNEVVQRRLSAMFRRKEGEGWNYEEQCGLLTVCRRPAVLEELKELSDFKFKRDSYFPQSIIRLLSDWQATLDRSRNHVEQRKKPKDVAI